MVRVIHILPRLTYAGAEQMAVSLIQNLDHKRFKLAVASMFDASGTILEETLAHSGISIWYLGKRPGFDPRMWTRIARLVRSFRPQVVHTHTYALRYALPSALFSSTPTTVHTVHNVAEREADWWADRWVRRLAFRGGRVTPVAVGPEVASSLARVYGTKGFPIIPNGIPVDTYQYPRITRESWRRREGLAPDDTVFVCVARLTPQKNHALLMEAFAQGPALYPHTYLLLVGDVREDAHVKLRLQKQISTLGLQGRVRFMGLRTDIPEVLNSSDGFVLSSSWEGTPLSVMEAMSAGKPVVSTAVGGVPGLVEDAKSGLLVPPGNAKALARAMNYLLKNPESRRTMGEAAAIRAMERFDVRVMAKAYENLYEKLLVKN